MIEQEATVDTSESVRARRRRRRRSGGKPTAQQLLQRIQELLEENDQRALQEGRPTFIIELKNPSKKIVMFKPGSAESSERVLSREFFVQLFDARVGLAQAFLPGIGGLLRQDPNSQKQQLYVLRICSADDADRYVKGLKQLSKKVREVVQNSEPLSYRDVANQLIIDSELYLASLEKGEREKEEKNIKRRVYDALNVLIASKILVKQGKKVMGNVTEGALTSKDLAEKIVAVRLVQDRLEKKLQAKQAEQEELEQLANHVQLHFASNRANESESCVRGPLVAALVGRNHQIRLSPNHRHLSICSDEPIMFLDEVEVARRLHM